MLVVPDERERMIERRTADLNKQVPPRCGVRGFSPPFGAGLQSLPKSMEYRMLTNGPDRRGPPRNASEGHACRAR
jgi:hypothetical protein